MGVLLIHNPKAEDRKHGRKQLMQSLKSNSRITGNAQSLYELNDCTSTEYRRGAILLAFDYPFRQKTKIRLRHGQMMGES